MVATAAGTLEIQLVSDVVRLQADMKATQRIIDNMTGSATAGAARMGTAFQKAGQQVSSSAGQQKQGLQQLSFQLGDIATQYASGTKASVIFAQQASQVFQAIQLLAGGTSKFAAFMGGAWGAALTAGVVVLTPFISSLLEGEKALKAAEFASYSFKDAQGVLGSVMDLTTGKINTQSKALHALAQAQALAMQVEARSRQAEAGRALQAARDPQWYLEGGLGGGINVGRRRSAAAGVVTRFQGGNLGGKEAVRELDDLRAAGKLTERQFLDLAAAVANFGVEGENVKVAEQLEQALNGDTKAVQGFLKVQKDRKTASERLAERLARESEALETLISGLYNSAEAFTQSTAAGIRARLEAEAMEKGIRRQADAQAYAAQQLRKYVAEQVATGAEEAASLNDQIRAQEFVNKAVQAGTIHVDDAAEALNNMAEQRDLLTAMQIAGANNDVRGYQAAEKALASLTEAQLKDIKARKQAADLQRAAQVKQQTQDIDLETKLTLGLGKARITALRGLRGDALENELANIAAEHEKIAIQARAEADATRELERGYKASAKAVLAKAEADKTQVDATAEIERQIRALDQLNQRVSESISLIGSIPGLGNFGSDFANILGRLNDTNFGNKFLKNMEGTLDKFFGGDGAFNEALGAFGVAVQANQLIGDIVGFKGGPLGIFTSLVESIFKKDKYGSSVVTASGVTLRGNNNDAKSGADSLGNALNTSLQNLAKMLNTMLGQFAVSIGVTNGKINVNPGTVNGKIGTTFQRDTIDFGKDEAGALKWAIQNAIEDGAFAGLSEGVKKFLTSGDVEQQIQRYMNLQSAFEELSSLKDPQGYALTQLDKAFTELRATATEAGEDLARVEELYGLKRAEIAEKYSAEIASVEDKRALQIQILELEGNTIAALTMARQAEKDAADASLASLYDRRNALQDEAQAAQEAAAASDRVLSLQQRYSRAIGDEGTARAIERMQEMNSAQTEQERSMLRSIYAAEDLVDQQSKATEATNMFANMIANVADAAYKASAELRAYANQIFDDATRTDPAVLLQQIQAAMKAGNTSVLPELIKAYLPMVESQSGSLADYQRQVAYLRQGSINAADFADARTAQAINAMQWGMRAQRETGNGEWRPETMDGYTRDQASLSGITKEQADRIIDLLDRANKDRAELSIDNTLAVKDQTRLLDDWTNGGTEAPVAVAA